MAKGGARVHIYGDWDGSGVKKAQQDISAFEKQANGFAGGFTKSMLGVGAALGGAFAVGNIIGAVTDYLRDAAQAAIEDEKSMVALATAMDNVGLAAQNAGAEDFVKSLMLATGVADDQLRPALQRLVTATGDLGQSQDLLNTALDISAATGRDVVAVSQALARASTGQISALTRLGVPLDANIIKSKDFGAAVDSLNEKFGGQAAAAAETYGGQLKRVQTAAAEAQETIGYALLQAVSDVSDAFGGTSGATGVIDGFGQATANLITGIGYMATEIAKLTAAMAANNDEGTDWGDNLRNYALLVGIALPPLAGMAAGIEQVTDLGEQLNAQKQREADEIAGVTALYAGYKANSDRAHSATVALTAAAEDEADALQQVSDAAKELLGILSNSQSIDDFRKALADLDTTLKGNPRSFKGMGDAAKENRDTLRSALGDAAKIAQQWVEDGKISADQYEAAYKGLSKKVVNQFVRDGFKRADIEAFLGGEGIWTGPANARLTAAEKAALRTAYSGFKGVGANSAKGYADGLLANGGVVAAAAVAVAHQGINAANKTLGIQSPSRVFMEIGRQTIAGFVEGMASKDAEVRDQARKSMLESVRGTIGDTRQLLKDAVGDIKADMTSLRDSISSSLMGNIDLGGAQDMTSVNEAGESVAMSFIDGLKAQVNQVTTFTNKITELIGQGMTPGGPLMSMLLQETATTGTAIANELLTGGAARISEAQDLILAAQTASTKLGTDTAASFYGTGLETARNMLKGFNEDFRPGGEGYERLMNRMDKLANDMDRTARITVVVDEVAGAKVKVDGARAAGGPVWPGGAFIVGERGPELFMPEVKGTILPSASMPSASGGAAPAGGNTYAITVQAGVGDPRQIGQQVVEYIRRFEQANGNVFAAA